MERKIEPSEKKKKEVGLIKELLSKYKTVGLLDLTNLPSPQLQSMRKKLKDTEIRVTKKRLIRIALKEVDKGVEKLEEVLDKIMPALILSNESSFKIANFLKKNESLVAAKAGQIAPKDLIVSAGPTSLPPGPVIGELGAVGIKASVEEGKIAVKEDSVVVKEGEEISGKVADILTKLGIKPMEIGVNLVATFEDGSIFKKDILEVDESVYVDKLKEIVSNALNLSVKIGYVTKDNVNLVLSKVEGEALALDKVVNKERDKVKKELSQGDKEGEVLAKKVEENKPKEESKPEEKKEGEKVEIKDDK